MSTSRDKTLAQMTTTPVSEIQATPEKTTHLNTSSLADLFKAIKAADMMVLNDTAEDIQAALQIYTQAIEHPKYSSVLCYKSRAGAYHRLGKFKEALQDYSAYLATHAQDADVHTQKAWTHFYSEQYPEALESITQALHFNHNLTKAKNTLISFGKELLEKKLGASALVFLKLALMHYPQHPDLYYLLGSAYDLERDNANAISTLEQALKQTSLNPSYRQKSQEYLARAYTLQGDTYLLAKLYQQAIEACLKAMQHCPEYAALYCCLGNIYLVTKKLDLALNHFKRAAELKKDYAEAYIGLGNVYADKKAYTLAEKHYLDALKLAPTHPDIHNNLGIIYNEQERYVDSIEAFQTCIKNNPPQSSQTARAYANNARVYHSLGKIPLAIEALKETVKIEPHSTLGKEYLAGLYQLQATQLFKEENFTAAIENLTPALDLAQDTRKLKNALASCHYRLGLQIADKDLDAALHQLDLSLGYNPLIADNFCNRAVLHMRKGNINQSLDDFAKALELDSNHYPSLYNRGLHHYHQKNYDQSIDDLKKVWNGGTLIAARITLIKAYIERAQQYSEANKLDEAIADLVQLNIWAPAVPEYKKALAQHYQLRAQQHATANQAPAAVADLKQALELAQDLPDLEKSLAELCFQQGIEAYLASQQDSAIEFFKEAAQYDPSQIQAYYYHAHALIGKNLHSEAILLFKECLQRDPSFSKAENDLGVTLKALKYNTKQVLPYYHAAIRHNPEFSQAYFNLGNIYYDLNDLTAAFANYREVVKLDPNDQEAQLLLAEVHAALFNRGAAYIKDGKNQDAAKDFACLAESNTQNADILYNCGLAYCFAERFTEALHYLKQAEQVDPGDHKIHFYLALSYQETKDFKTAINKYRLVKQLAPDFARECDLDQQLAFCSEKNREQAALASSKQPTFHPRGNYSSRQFKSKSAQGSSTYSKGRQENNVEPETKKGYCQ